MYHVLSAPTLSLHRIDFGMRDCVGNVQMSNSTGNLAREVLGEQSAEIMRDSGVAYLDVFELLNSQYSAHVPDNDGLDRAHDCLHWHVPGLYPKPKTLNPPFLLASSLQTLTANYMPFDVCSQFSRSRSIG